jgi:hypothetical protein
MAHKAHLYLVVASRFEESLGRLGNQDCAVRLATLTAALPAEDEPAEERSKDEPLGDEADPAFSAPSPKSRPLGKHLVLTELLIQPILIRDLRWTQQK